MVFRIQEKKMNKFAIFGDTSQNLNYEIGKDFEIEVMPYYLQMGENNFKDLVDITSREFYETMENYDSLSTGTPPIQEVIDCLDKVKTEGCTEALLITSSEKMTSMYSLYGTIKSHYEGMELYLFDTGQIGAGAGVVTVYAGQLKKEGKSLQEILKELERIKDQSGLFALFRTLKYLVKGGRFNKYKGMIGTLLNINPLLSTVDGEITVLDKVRGGKASLAALIKTIKKELGDSKSYYLFIFSGDNEAELAIIKDQLKEEIENAKVFLETEFTPVLGVHAGPKSIGIATLRLD